MIIGEIWKDVKGFEGLYQVSNFGNVKSAERFVNHSKGGLQKRKSYILKPKINKGYCHVYLCKESKHTTLKVHRLVALHFIDNPDNKPEVNHIDGNKLNNNVWNLEWCTKSENGLHSFRVLGRIAPFLDKTGILHPRSKCVVQYAKSGEFISEYSSLREAGRITKINNADISSCCNNKLKSAGGYVWKFT